MSNIIDWIQNVSSNVIPTIFGVWLTFKYQRQKDKQDRVDRIKPIIFVRLTNTDSKIQDETNGVFQFFQSLGMIYGDQNVEKRSLEFSLYVQGDYPAKNIKFKGFEITEEDNRILNLGTEINMYPAFGTKEDSKPLWNFSQPKTNIDWKHEPLTVFKGESRKLEILLSYKDVQLEYFLQKHWDLSFDITKKLFSELIPVTARFSYEDIDGNEYEDLSIKFFTGLTLQNDLIEPLIAQGAPFADNPLTDKFVKYQTDQIMKGEKSHGQNKEK